jgi:HKD family nuclease
MKPYIQIQNQQSTLDHWKQILEGNELASFGAFAYVTDSGVAQMRTHLTRYFGNSRYCRWLFGCDYGRSHPAALRDLAGIRGGEVRIHDGEYVVQSKAFVPRVIYHIKTALTLLETGYPCKQIVGSGNLSASGLSSGIEGGCVVDFREVDREFGNALISTLEEMWERATPLARVIEEYEAKYVLISTPTVRTPVDEHHPDANELFWIDVGYVTKNRGPDRPGNQFDLPRRSHVYLGLEEVQNPTLNSPLGDLRIRTPTGQVVERPLRYGNNAMEKLTLPIPEEYGYKSYDGKILTFEIEGHEVVLEAFEYDDFFRIYGTHINSCSEMQSGRRYGTISLRS